MKKATIKDFYRLAKPGIIYGNIFTTIAAFVFASGWSFGSVVSLKFFFATVIGLSLVIGSACVFNNYLDRDIDARMSRTKNRALVTGTISVRNALIYGAILGVIGFALLFFFVNLLSTVLALIGFVFYVGIYGVVKRKSYLGAVVGSVPGAVPIVVGYTAVVDRLDLGALILFIILVAWQMPHFYAIAMYRLDEYKAAGIPVLPAKKGAQRTKIHILLYIIAYIIASALLTPFFARGLPQYFYIASVLIFGLRWLLLCVDGFIKKDIDNAKWARKLFLFSLIVLVTFSITIALAPFLPSF